MAEACGFCYRSFLQNRKTNESFKCACGRPFFSQTVARNNVPSDRDCWIEVPKRFVRHYSSLFGETVNFEGDDGRAYSCCLVGSDIAIVGYGFEWYDFASSHNVSLGDHVVLTLMEKSRFLVQVYRAHVKVEVEQDVDVQVARAQDWLEAKARRSSTNITDRAPDVESMPSTRAPNEKVRKYGVDMFQKKKAAGMSSTSKPTQHEVPNDCLDDTEIEDDCLDDTEIEDAEASSSSTSDSDWSLDHKVLDKKNGSKENNCVEDDSGSTSTAADNMTEEEELRSSSKVRRGVLPSKPLSDVSDDGEKCTRSPILYVAPRVTTVHQFSEPGTTIKRTYASKRGPVSRDDRDKAFEAAKACPITHNSFLRTLEKATCYRALSVVIPAPWFRENMPETNRSYLATVVNEEGNSWQVRIRGIEIYWGNFSLDHYLEEGDVVVMELMDPRLKSLKFLVHIFRVVHVQVTLTGKAGWAMHYDIVEGIKKRKQEVCSKGKGRLERKHRRGSDSKAETSHRRRTRRQAVVEDSEEEVSEESLPLKDEHPISSDLMEVKMEYATESNDGGPKTKVLSRKVKIETAI